MRKENITGGSKNLHLDLDSEYTLPQHDVPDGVVNKVLGGLTGMNHETVGELHRLCTSSTKLARDNDLATFRARLHNETKDTIARPVMRLDLLIP